jgi:hypothetical protein
MPLDLNRQADTSTARGCRRCGEPVTVYVNLRASHKHMRGKAGSTIGSASAAVCGPCAVAVFDAAEAVILATEPR